MKIMLKIVFVVLIIVLISTSSESYPESTNEGSIKDPAFFYENHIITVITSNQIRYKTLVFKEKVLLRELNLTEGQ
jgi:hypothetical protein